MAHGSYKQFCPVAMAAEVLCTRWTMVLLRELVAGSTRFNDLRRGVPRMSPALLSKRLRDLGGAGIVRRVAVPGEPGIHEYHLTRAGRELKAVVDSIGIWGQHWVETQLTLENLDPSLLMWDMRRNLDPTPMPNRRCVVHFAYADQPATRRRWWLVIEPKVPVDLCSVDPGFDVDLYVNTDLRTMTAIWMGLATVRDAVADGKLKLTGDRALANHMQAWLGLSPFAAEKKLAMT
jgi:DNA-binding HxlR family transcriptional regulator